MQSAAGPSSGGGDTGGPTDHEAGPGHWRGRREKTPEELLPSFGDPMGLWILTLTHVTHIYSQKGFGMPNLVSTRYYLMYTLGLQKDEGNFKVV